MSINESLFNASDIYQLHHRFHEYDVLRIHMKCPYCNSSGPACGPLMRVIAHEHIPSRYVAVNCETCKKAVLLEMDKDVPMYDGQNFEVYRQAVKELKVKDYHPKGSPTVDPAIRAARPDIADDFAEAQRCYYAGAFQACGVMVRRCMHSLVEHLGAKPSSNLFEPIEWLRDNHKLDSVLADAAHQIRVLGRDGAHPYDSKGNLWPQLSSQDAEYALRAYPNRRDWRPLPIEKMLLGRGCQPRLLRQASAYSDRF